MRARGVAACAAAVGLLLSGYTDKGGAPGPSATVTVTVPTAPPAAAAAVLGPTGPGTAKPCRGTAIPRPRPAPPELDAAPASTTEKELRRELCEFIRRGYRQRLLISTGGSFSARLDADGFVISSYGVDRDAIGPGDLTLVRGGRGERGRRPSRAWQIHQRIYEAYPQVRSVVNATPVNATAFSVTGTKLDARTIPESYLFLGDVPVVPFEHQFGDGRAVAQAVSPRQPVALMENNGALILGKSVLETFDRLEVLESTAAALIRSRSLGPIRPMSDAIIEELVEAFPSV